MSEQKLNNSLQHFCGESQATGLFVEANYNGGNFNQPLNSATNPDLAGQTLGNLMYAVNYNNKSKDMQDNDVHNQFVDFIVRTALFHREIDNPTTIGSTMSDIKQSLNDGFDFVINTKISDLPDSQQRSIATRSNEQFIVISTANRSNKSFAINDILDDPNKSIFDYLNANILAMYLSQSDANVENINNSVNEFNSPTKSGVLRGRVQDQIDRVLGNCTTQGNQTDFCFISRYVSGVNNKSVQDAMNVLTDKATVSFGAPNRTAARTTTTNTINNALNRAFEKYIIMFLKKINAASYFQYIRHNNVNRNEMILKIKELLNSLGRSNESGVQQSFKNAVTDEIYNALKGDINFNSSDNTLAPIKYREVSSNEYATKIFENVFLRWQQLSSEERNFFRQQLHVFRKVGETTGTPSDQAGWDDIGDNVENPNYLPNVRRDMVRLNLVKTHPGSSDVLFGKTLPFVAVGTKLWYSTPGNVLQSIVADSTDVLQKLYQCVYMAEVCANFVNLPTNFSQVKDNIATFDISDTKFIKNLIRQRRDPQMQMAKPTFNNMFMQDITTNVIYFEENGQLYHMMGNQKMTYNYDNIKEDNCLGSGLNPNNGNCNNLVRDCLITGDRDALKENLASLGNQNLFAAAQNDMDPDVAIQILKTFGFEKVIQHDPVHGNYAVIQPFHKWKETILNTLDLDVQKTILGNHKLCEYLKGVVAFVQQNPAILNRGRNVPQYVPKQMDNAYLQQLKKKQYKSPLVNGQRRALFVALKGGFSSAQNAFISNTYTTLPYSNVMPIEGTHINPHGSMTGGFGSYGTYDATILRRIGRNGHNSALIENLMEDLYKDMNRAGLKISDNDMAALRDGTTQLKHMEKTMFDYHMMLRTVTDLFKFFSASGCTVPKADEFKQITFDDIKSRTQTLQFLAQNIADAKMSINDCAEAQNAKCKEMLDFYDSLATTTL